MHTDSALKARRNLTEESLNRYEKAKEASAYLKKFSSQSMRDYDKFNARLKYN